MSFYYTREPGAEGQILTGDGEAVGLPLSDLIDDAALPVRAALELMSYLADILTIAEEDRVAHGDIKPGNVRIDESGSVSIEGWGVDRRSGRAPEGANGEAPADVYGLASVLHASLSRSGLGALPRDRESHDAAVSDKLASLDWQDLSDKRWMDEVLHFICGMMSFEADIRPEPLDVANILGQVAQQAPGEGLIEWSSRVVEPLSVGGPKRPAAYDQVEEDLGGPEALAAPVSQNQAASMRKGAAAKGEATSMWTRDRIAQMLAMDDDDEEDSAPVGGEPVRQRFEPSTSRRRNTPAPKVPQRTQPPAVPPFPDATVEGQLAVDPRDMMGERRPSPPRNLSSHDPPEPAALRPSLGGPPMGGSAFDAPPPGRAPAPPPGRAPGHAPAAPPAFGGRPPAGAPPTPFGQAGQQPPGQQRPGQQPPGQQPPGQWAQGPGAGGPIASGPVASGPVASGPVASGGAAQTPFASGPIAHGGVPPGPKSPPEKKGGALKIVFGVGLLLVVLCGGGSVLSAGAWFYLSPGSGDSDIRAVAVDPDEAVAPEAADTGTEAEKPPPEEPKAKKKEPKSTTSTRKSSSSSSGGSSRKSSSSSSGGSSSSSRKSSSSSSSGGSSRSSSSSSGGSSSSGSSSGGSSSSSSSSGGAAAAPVTGSFPATVKWVHQGVETTLECSPGGRSTFVGTTRMEISDVTTCRVKTETGMTAVQLRAGGTVTCSEAGGRLLCTGP